MEPETLEAIKLILSDIHTGVGVLCFGVGAVFGLLAWMKEN